MAWATDPTNENELKETREFLNNRLWTKINGSLTTKLMANQQFGAV
jgi:hypothetical protein